MRLVIQRVNRASVRVDGNVIGSIGKGLLILLGVANGDTKEMVDRYVKKLSGLRIFEDADGKTNLSLADVGGELLVVSQFTLAADCKKGTRPGFDNAEVPQRAKLMYEKFVGLLKSDVPVVKTGVFAAMMDVSLVNDGPVTFVLEKRNS